jgi:hypothetical protein
MRVMAAALTALTATVMVTRPGSDGSDRPPREPAPVVVEAAQDAGEPDAGALALAAGDAVWQVVAEGCGISRTGSAIAVSDRLLVTSFPLVVHDGTPTVVGADGTRREASVVALRQSPDVAVLAVTEPLPNDTWGDPGFGLDDGAYGTEPVLDRLWDRCAAGEATACGDLARVAPADSAQLAFAATCGTVPGEGAAPPGGTGGGCGPTAGPHNRSPARTHVVGACLALPRRPEGEAVAVACADPHDAQVFAVPAVSPPPTAGATGTDEEGAPTGPDQHLLGRICDPAFADLLRATPLWDLLWRPGHLAPAPGMAVPGVACFAWTAGRSADVAVPPAPES